MGNGGPQISRNLPLVKQQIGIRVPGVLALLAVPCDNTTTKGMNHLTLPGQLCVCKDECGSVQGVFALIPDILQLGLAILDTDLVDGGCCLWQAVHVESGSRGDMIDVPERNAEVPENKEANGFAILPVFPAMEPTHPAGERHFRPFARKGFVGQEFLQKRASLRFINEHTGPAFLSSNSGQEVLEQRAIYTCSLNVGLCPLLCLPPECCTIPWAIMHIEWNTPKDNARPEVGPLHSQLDVIPHPVRRVEKQDTVEAKPKEEELGRAPTHTALVHGQDEEARRARNIIRTGSSTIWEGRPREKCLKAKTA